jgi:hypothetical protein
MANIPYSKVLKGRRKRRRRRRRRRRKRGREGKEEKEREEGEKEEREEGKEDEPILDLFFILPGASGATRARRKSALSVSS